MAADLIQVLHLLGLAITTGVAGPVFGQALSDPTRPPDAFRLPAGSEPVAPVASRLSSQPVVILSGDRRQVTINGQTAKIGGRIGDAIVIRISDTEVVLQGADSTETIRLYGGVEKKLLKPRPDDSRDARAARTETVK